MKNARLLLPVLLCFFAMGALDLVGIATNYFKADLGLSDSQAGFALSTCIVSNPIDFNPSNSFLTTDGFGLGVSESSSDP